MATGQSQRKGDGGSNRARGAYREANRATGELAATGAKGALVQRLAGLPVREQLATLEPARPMAPVQRQTTGGGGGAGTDPMAALPKTREEIADSVDSVGMAATMRAGRTLAKEGPVTLRMLDGTRLSVRADAGGLFIGARPGLLAEVDWLPDAEINSLRYDFRKAEFSAEASGAGPDFIYGWAVAAAANKFFKPRLPAKMQGAGYSPHRDEDTAGTFQALSGLFEVDGDTEFPNEDVRDVSASVDFRLKDGLVVPIAGGTAEFRIEPNARISLSGELSGASSDPKVERIRIGNYGGDVRIAKVGDGFAANLQVIILRSVTIGAGGALSFDYDLEVEGMLEGLVGLAKLFALMAGEPRAASGGIPDIKLKAIREQVDAKLSAEVGPQLRALIQQYDDVVPGMSLVKAFGL
jgi:hypothetical protein